jgi:DNA-binding NtrC family response regulator
VTDILRLHDWPGNIRELQNFIERAVVVTTGSELHPPLSELTQLTSTTTSVPARTLAELERTYIAETLQRTNWIIGGRAGAAAKLGLPRTTLLGRMRKLGISRDTFRPLCSDLSSARSERTAECPPAWAQTAAAL